MTQVSGWTRPPGTKERQSSGALWVYDADGRAFIVTPTSDGLGWQGLPTCYATEGDPRRLEAHTLRDLVASIAESRQPMAICPGDGNGLSDDGVCGFCGCTPAAYIEEESID